MTSKGKKVHYGRDTKGGKSHGHRSRDSGVGSSSASDRASIGTSAVDELLSYEQLEDQRHVLSVVQEALDAANEQIRRLEVDKMNLNAELSESNKENRMYKREKTDMLNTIDSLKRELDMERALVDRLGGPSVAAPSKSSRPERRTTPPRREARESAPRHYEDERPTGIRDDRRESWKEMPVPKYEAPQPPPNNQPNPFTPQNPFTPNSTRRMSSSAYAPASPTTYASSASSGYAPSSASYASPASSAYSGTYAPQQYAPHQQIAIPYPGASLAHRTAPPRSDRSEDGNYKPHPLPRP